VGEKPEQHGGLGSSLYKRVHRSIETLTEDNQFRIDYPGKLKPDQKTTEEYIFIPGVLSNVKSPGYHLRHYLKKQGASSLEQAAATFGKFLNKEQQALAAFEHDFWHGLSECRINWEEAEKFVSEIYGVLPEPESLGIVELDDLKLCRVNNTTWEKAAVVALRPEKTNKNTRNDGYEDCLERGETLPVRPIFVLGYGNSGDAEKVDAITRATRIAYSGNPRYLDYFSELFVSEYWRSRCHMTIRLGKHLLHFEAELDTKEGNPDTVDRLVSDILSTVLISGRPLRYYSATFYFPVDLHGAKFKKEPRKIADEAVQQKVFADTYAEAGSKIIKDYREYNESKIDAQALRYFSPLLRKQIFNIKGERPRIKPILEYRMELEDNTRLCLQHCSGKSISAQVENLSLYRHHHKMGLLAIRVTMPISRASWDNYGKADHFFWWRDLFVSSQNAKSCQVENWLTFTHHARILYPSFLEQWDEKKISELEYNDGTDSPRTNFKSCKNNSIVEDLLERVLVCFTEDPKKMMGKIWKNIRDDRMFVNVAYALAGPIPGNRRAKIEYRRLFSLAQHVDRQCDTSPEGFAYSPGFVEACADRQIYTRWEEFGSLYGFTDHSHVYMGVGREMRERIAPIHVPHLYGRLTILNLLHKNIFHYYEHEISARSPVQLETNNTSTDYNDFRELRDDFTDFTNRYWFHEVTEQQQGKEIYTMQGQEMGLEKHHGIIRDEIESTEQFQQDKIRDRITLFGVTFTLLAVILGMLSLDSISTKITGPVEKLLVEPAAKLLVDWFVQYPRNPVWRIPANVKTLVEYTDLWLHISLVTFFTILVLYLLARGMSMKKIGGIGGVLALVFWLFLPVALLFFADLLSICQELTVHTVLFLLTALQLLILLVIMGWFCQPFLEHRDTGKSLPLWENIKLWVKRTALQRLPDVGK